METEIRTKREAPTEILYGGHTFVADEWDRMYIKLVDTRLCRTRLNEPQGM
jgi:hypothetical protein